MLHESESSPINKKGYKESTFMPESKLNKAEDKLDKLKEANTKDRIQVRIRKHGSTTNCIENPIHAMAIQEGDPNIRSTGTILVGSGVQLKSKGEARAGNLLSDYFKANQKQAENESGLPR